MMPGITSHLGLQIKLPVREGNKEKWDSLGVRWIDHPSDGNPFLVMAELPLGWNVREKAATDFDKKSFTVLDNDNLPKADVYLITTPWNQKGIVHVFSDKEAAEMKVTLAQKAGQKEFDSLIANYNLAVRTTHGRGQLGQISIDRAYVQLETFVEGHPDFRSDLPTKHLCPDDGLAGFSGLVINLSEDAREGDCSIM